MYYEPIVLRESPRPGPDAATRIVGIFAVPISLAIMAAWLTIGTVFIGGVVLVHLVGRAFRHGLAAIDYAGATVLRR